MNLFSGKMHPLKSLLILGLISAVLWRVEVELHGWYGLIWIGYFHWAIPVGCLLFIGWLWANCSIESVIRKAILIVLFLVYAGGAYKLSLESIRAFYAPVWVFFCELPLGWQLWIFSVFAIFPLLPLPWYIASGVCKRSITWKERSLSYGAYLLSFPVAIALLWITRHKGGADWMHAIKSGYVIPFLFVSFGLPFLPMLERRTTNEN